MRTFPLVFDKAFAMQKWNILESEIPEVLIIQGQRLIHPHLRFVETSIFEESRRLIMQDVIIGKYKQKNMLFASGFGAAILADITHFAALLGVKYVIIIGTIGGLHPELHPHDIVLPQIAIQEDGVSHWYVEKSVLLRSDQMVNETIEQELEKNQQQVHKGNIISVPSMLCETTELINFWSSSNIYGVDLETSAVFAVAHKFGIPYAGMLYVIDNLIQNHDITKLNEQDRLNSFAFMEKITQVAFDAAYTLLA